MQWTLFLLSNLLYMSPKLQEYGSSSQVHGEVVEVEVGQATDHLVDVLLIVDTSPSVGDNYIWMIRSFMDFLSNFDVGDDDLRIAVVQCHGRDENPEKLTLLDLKYGNSREAVYNALSNLEIDLYKPFKACFEAALVRVFVQENGDRYDASNIVIFASDAMFYHHASQGAPTEEVESLKQNNVTIIAISFCAPGECLETISNNDKIASRPEYSVHLEDFNANNKDIRNALQRSANCTQKVELADCTWVGNASCERSIIPDEHFSNKICQKNGDRTTLITQAVAEDSKSCAIVNKITSNKTCVLDNTQKCRVRNFKVENRASNLFDDARSGYPIAEDLEACRLTEPNGEDCPEIICQAADCKFGRIFNVEYCENVHLLKHCMKELKAKCQGSDDIDMRCYPFYFARNKTLFTMEVQETWTNGKPVVTKVEKRLKDLCENNSLRLNCSKWMKDKFDANPIDICFNVGSKIAVECLKDQTSAACSNNTGNFTKEQACDELCTSKDPKIYIQCIEEKQKRWYTHNKAPYPCKKHISDWKILTGTSTVKPPDAVTNSPTSVEKSQTKDSGTKAAGLSNNLDETSDAGSTRSRPTKSVVSAKSKTTTSAASKSKAFKSHTLDASKPTVEKRSGKNGSKITKIETSTKEKGSTPKNAIKSSKISKAKK